MGCHVKAHKSLVRTIQRNICDKYEEMESREKSGGFKEHRTGIYLHLGILVRLKYALMQGHCTFVHCACRSFTDIAATESHFISSQRQLLASISPFLFFWEYWKVPYKYSPGTLTMPFPPPPVDTIGTTRLHFLKLLLTADSYADWDNIGFKVREGMCDQAAFTNSLTYDLCSQRSRRITLQHYNRKMERTAIRRGSLSPDTRDGTWPELR